MQVEGVALEQRLATSGLPSLGRSACTTSSRERLTINEHCPLETSNDREAVPLPTVSLEISNGSSLTYLPASRHDVTPGDTHTTLILSDHAPSGEEKREAHAYTQS